MIVSPIKLLLSLLFLSCIVSCNSVKCKSKRYLNHSISIEKTACFGTCPQYIMTINGAGEMQFNGKKFTKMDGNWKAQLEVKEKNQLFGEIEQAQLSKLADEYPTNYSDLPSTILTYSNGKIIKTIRIEGTHPAILDEIITKLESKIENAQWINLNTH